MEPSTSPTSPSVPTSPTSTVFNRHVSNDTVAEPDEKVIAELGEEIKQFYEPTRIWYAATVFPLAAGCFGPLATALSICALAEEWRVIIPAGGAETDEQAISNPSWLVAINAVSLSIGVLANLSLLLSMAHRLPFKIAQAATIVGWYISSIMLLVVIALTPTHLQGGTTYSYGQPFVYACLAAVMYFILASLLVFTTAGAVKGYYDPDFSVTLTLPQRTLMVQSIGFITWLVGGAAVFAHIEGWLFVDGVYWATVTLLTIGYGDVTPATHLGRSLIIPYATCGIVMIGFAAGSIGAQVLDLAQKKMVARLTLKQKQQLQSSLDKQAMADQSHDSEHVRERAEFHLMRRIQVRARRRQLWFLSIISTVALILLWFIGALVFWQTERVSSFQTSTWSYFDAIYFVFISLLTIGYGDFYVRSNIGRPIFVFWALLAVPTMTILIASMGATVLIIAKGIIAQIDRFIVLPHQTKGDSTSFVRKAFHMGKLYAKHHTGYKGDGHEGGLERHGEHGFRDHRTGRIMNIHEETGHIPHPDHDHDEAVMQRKYLIAKEINGLLVDLSASPSRTYTFEEWARFLKLLGVKHRESDMPAKPAKPEENGVNGETMENNWSWLRVDGPLFGSQTETEWLLQRLSKQLEDSLKPIDDAATIV